MCADKDVFHLQGDQGQRGLMGESGPSGEQVCMMTRNRSGVDKLIDHSLCV